MLPVIELEINRRIPINEPANLLRVFHQVGPAWPPGDGSQTTTIAVSAECHSTPAVRIAKSPAMIVH